MKIIVQAGGLGTRMKSLTASKPKALIAVQNKPILFHLFDAFPEADFIVVGDYNTTFLTDTLVPLPNKKTAFSLRRRERGTQQV